MASRPKQTLHKVRCFVDEFVVSDVKESVKKRPKKDNNLYEVEIKEVDRQNKRIRIHFKGYDARFDEWRPIVHTTKRVNTSHLCAGKNHMF